MVIRFKNNCRDSSLRSGRPTPEFLHTFRDLGNSKQLTPRRQGAKQREGEVVAFLCELCVLCGFA
ncbi:hypothetical protein SBA2_310027 [Acidobacteriia bacterium SbA2]|nr:hypothetical protein SBA2_310027 [Acidobacteriia bacterium SbA2]